MLQPGEILDHYRIEAEVARGGMGTLLRAVDLDTGQTVAIKLPHPEVQADPVQMERFDHERAIGRLLDHPGIVKTLDSAAGGSPTSAQANLQPNSQPGPQGEPQSSSQPYLVLEWVEGRLLRSLLREQAPLPVERAAAICLGLCQAVDAMHRQGIVHRDLKPENIMIGEHDQVKIIDFGVALNPDARRITVDSASPMLGTPDYIAPEQVEGKRTDQRSDIYVLGILLYEMLTGEVPFSGPSPLAVMHERLVRPVPSPRALRPQIPAALEEIVFRAVERQPRHRYATTAEMAWDLEHQDQLGIDPEADTGSRPALETRSEADAGPAPKAAASTGSARARVSPATARQLNRRLWFYAGLALLPVALFALMLALARMR